MTHHPLSLILLVREDKLKIIKALSEKIGQKIPSYQEFEANFMQICYTNNITKQKSLVKYVLSKIHAVYTKDTVTNNDLMTIEHILPQSKIGHDGYTDKEIGQLGNLILVPADLNADLGHAEFLDKRGVIDQEGVFLDEKVSEASTWDQEQIKDRTKWMAKLAYDKIWKIE